MKLFKGQKVHVMATVDNPEPDHEGDIRLILRADWASYVKPESIVHAEPAPLAVGDLVTWGDGICKCTIRHIDDGVAFLKFSGTGAHTHLDVSDLRRVAT